MCVGMGIEAVLFTFVDVVDVNDLASLRGESITLYSPL